MARRMNCNEYDIRLISEVEKNPVIYDENHEYFKRRDYRLATWKRIAHRLRENSSENSVKLVKNRWKSLRDAMVRETRQKLREDIKQKKDWRYMDAMTFLIPYMAESKTVRGERGRKRFPEISSTEPLPKKFVCKYIREDQPIVQQYVVAEEHKQPTEASEMTYNNNCQDDDEIDIFFKGIAETVKKLAPEKQEKIQKDIMNIVLDTKLWEIEENKDPSDPS